MKFIFIAACSLLTLAVPPLVTAQASHAEVGARADMRIPQPLVVGTETLAPGDYKFQCITKDGQHFLTVTSSRGQEVARVPCTPEELGKKVEVSEFRTLSRPDGTKALTAVRIKGESVAHKVVMSGTT